MPRLRGSASTAILTVALTAVTAFGAAALPATPPSAGPPSAVDTSAFGYALPVDGAVLRFFEQPAQRWSAGHRGVDLAMSVGDAVHAPGPGVVTFSGRVVDRGVVTITHPDGLRSSLEPVSDTPPVGTQVVTGEVVGVLASGGHCGQRDCVHWGVRRGDTYVDPLSLFEVGPIVLLPIP